MERPRILVLASGSPDPDAVGGRTFANLVRDRRCGILEADIVGVASQHKDGNIARRASELCVPFFHLASRKSASYAAVLNAVEPTLTAMAGHTWLHPIPGQNTVNIHPALLPDHGGPGWYGPIVHQRVANRIREDLEAKRPSRFGLTIHFASGEYDRGPIIFQTEILVPTNHSPDEVTSAWVEDCVRRLEQYWYGRVLQRIIDESVHWDGDSENIVAPTHFQRRISISPQTIPSL